MRALLTYTCSLIVLAVLLGGCFGDGGRRIPSLVETYSKNDTRPFGGQIAYRQIEAMYDGNIIRNKKQDFKETWQNISDTGSLYICLASKLYLNDEETEAMMEYVSAGNSLVISAGLIDENLLDKLGCKEVYSEPLIENTMGLMKSTGVSSTQQPDFKYSYYYFPFENYFTGIDSTDTRVLGYNDNNKPNSIVHFYGKGKLYLQCEPRAFSNYFLLKENNYEYLKKTMAFTKSEPEHVYWDDHYNKIRSRKDTNKTKRKRSQKIRSESVPS